MSTSKYPASVREKARELYTQGHQPAEIAQITGVPRQTVAGWCHEYKKKNKSPSPLANVVVKPRTGGEFITAQRADDDRYAHFYNDPNVALLGDPPLHLSALGRKLRAEGKL